MIWSDSHIADLAKQLAYSPAEKRFAQMRSAAGLIAEIDAAKEYPWEFILYRITGYRPPKPVEDLIPGKTLRGDLSRLIEHLSATLNLPVGSVGEPVLSQEQAARELSVSDKTIQRWRNMGLIGRRYVHEDGRRRLGFLRGEIQAFITQHPGVVERATNFQQVSAEERHRIVRLAEHLAVRGGLNLKQISHRVGRKLGRSPETIRTIIRKHDRTHTEKAIFPDPGMAPPALGSAAMVAEYERGVSLDDIAVTFGRSRASVIKVLYEDRVQKARDMKIDWVHNPLFDLPDAEKIILTELPHEAAQQAAADEQEKQRQVVVLPPQDLPAYLQNAMRLPTLARELEADAFRRMNFLKYQAAQLQKQLDSQKDCESLLLHMAALLAQANKIKNDQVQRHLRVALFVARKHLRAGGDLLELVSDATIWLMHAADRYDFSRAARFGTYASYVMVKNFARDREDCLSAEERRMVTGRDELLNELVGREAEPIAEWAEGMPSREKLCELMRELPARERALLTDHYGLDPAHPAMSLSELGEKMGVTKARVQQLEIRALQSLKKMMMQENAER